MLLYGLEVGLEVCNFQSVCSFYMSHKGGQRHRYNGNLLLTYVYLRLPYEWYSLTQPHYHADQSDLTDLRSFYAHYAYNVLYKPTNQVGSNFMLKPSNNWHSLIQLRLTSPHTQSISQRLSSVQRVVLHVHVLCIQKLLCNANHPHTALRILSLLCFVKYINIHTNHIEKHFE